MQLKLLAHSIYGTIFCYFEQGNGQFAKKTNAYHRLQMGKLQAMDGNWLSKDGCAGEVEESAHHIDNRCQRPDLLLVNGRGTESGDAGCTC